MKDQMQLTLQNEPETLKHELQVMAIGEEHTLPLH